MDSKKTLLEEAMEEFCSLSPAEQNFFRDIEEKEKFETDYNETDIPDRSLPTIRADCLNWLFEHSLVIRDISSKSKIIIQGVYIQGDINCGHVILLKMLHFSFCYFSGNIYLFYSEFSSITFEHSIVTQDIYASHVEIKKSFLFINGSESHGCIT